MGCKIPYNNEDYILNDWMPYTFTFNLTITFVKDDVTAIAGSIYISVIHSFYYLFVDKS